MDIENRYTRAQDGFDRIVSALRRLGGAETLLVRVKSLAREHKARCLVIDPVSTLSKGGNELTAHGVAERGRVREVPERDLNAHPLGPQPTRIPPPPLRLIT